MVAIGDLPGDLADSIEEALEPTGARLVGVGVVREPVDLRGLAGDLSKTRFADIARNPDSQSAFGVGVGRQIVVGGTLIDQVRGHLFSRASRQLRRRSTASSSSATSPRRWARSGAPRRASSSRV